MDNMEGMLNTVEHKMYMGLLLADSNMARVEALKSLPTRCRDTCEAIWASGDIEMLEGYLSQQEDLADHYHEPWRGRIMMIVDEYWERIKREYGTGEREDFDEW